MVIHGRGFNELVVRSLTVHFTVSGFAYLCRLILRSFFRGFVFEHLLFGSLLYHLLQVEVVILSFLTNILIDSLTEESTEGDLQMLLSELFVDPGGLFTFCTTFPGIRVFLSPPNIRMKPAWYSRMRPTIIRTFHQFLQTGPCNLQAIEDFSGDLEPDQIHFTILSGIYFVQHLVDRVCELLSTPMPAKPVR